MYPLSNCRALNSLLNKIDRDNLNEAKSTCMNANDIH